MNIGPFHFTNEIPLGSLVTVASILFACFKYLRHFVSSMQETNERMDILWNKFNGKDDEDPLGWFYRMKKTEVQVNEMWGRLKFNRLSIDPSKTRIDDFEGFKQ